MADVGQIEADGSMEAVAGEERSGAPAKARSLWRIRNGRRSFYRYRVPSAFGVGALTLVLAEPTVLSLLLGLSLVAPGQGLRVWASGHIEKTRRLATGGPYSHTQHPLYLGSFLIGLGVAVSAAHPLILLAIVAYLLAFFPYVIRNEREFLHRKFGSEYELWAAEVPPFFPCLRPAGPRSTRFEWRRVLSNGEWQACLAPPAALALMYLKDTLLP